MSDPRERIEGLEPRQLFRAALGPDAGDPEAAEREVAQERRVRAEIEERLPDLELFELLGRGGMGYVYRARQKRLDREVAIKVVAPGVEQQAGFADRFAREAQALARLNHPGIVAVHDFGQDGSFCWLVMECVDGSNLRDLIRAGKLEPAEALVLVPKICDALQYAHDHGVVHRDVKPENILVDAEGGVKIADFGLAKLIGTPAALVSLTGSQQVLGTFRYMAPEQLDSPLEVDHRADIYSLGVVLYEMLTGEIPMGRFDPPSHRSSASPGIDEVVLRSLEKEPDRRYQRASEVKLDLESIERAAGPRVACLRPEPAHTGDGGAEGERPAQPSMRAVGAATLFGVGAIPFVAVVAVCLVAIAYFNGDTASTSPEFRVSFLALAVALIGLVSLILMGAGSVLGFRALGEIRRAWPRVSGAGSAIVGAWAGILLVATTGFVVVTWSFLVVPGEAETTTLVVTTSLLLTCEVAFLLAQRRRFLERCATGSGHSGFS
ncbi:MAG: protein kinase [bacterium]|nr:protein kinase [bacterium]